MEVFRTMVANNEIFSKLDLSKHNRYAIYKILGRSVTFPSSSRRQCKCSGVVQRVCRDIFDNHVELTVNGKLFRFREPALILQDGDSVLFIYGNVEASDMGDIALFQSMRDSSIGETASEVIRRTTPTKTKILKFILEPKSDKVPANIPIHATI